MRPFARSFFERPSAVVAVELLGHVLVSERGRERTSGRIVEVEAYYGSNDPASHAAKRRTARNSVMFGPPGRSYVYFTYGSQYLLNVVTCPSGTPGAVLIRALEPLEGVAVMMRRRGTRERTLLASGPARLTQALAVTGEDNDRDVLDGGPVRLEADWAATRSPVVVTERIGIREGSDLPLRYYLAGNPHVSKRVKPEGLTVTHG